MFAHGHPAGRELASSPRLGRSCGGTDQSCRLARDVLGLGPACVAAETMASSPTARQGRWGTVESESGAEHCLQVVYDLRAVPYQKVALGESLGTH
jgi:hypothetical protein